MPINPKKVQTYTHPQFVDVPYVAYVPPNIPIYSACSFGEVPGRRLHTAAAARMRRLLRAGYEGLDADRAGGHRKAGSRR